MTQASIDNKTGYIVKFCAHVDETTFEALNRYVHTERRDFDETVEEILRTFLVAKELMEVAKVFLSTADV